MTLVHQDQAVPAAPDNEAAVQHLVCPMCYPSRPAFETSPTALCGERLLGVPAPMDLAVCSGCAAVAERWERGESLPCGHRPVLR